MTTPPLSTQNKIAKLEAMMIDAKQRISDKAQARVSNHSHIDAAAAVARAMIDVEPVVEPVAVVEPVVEVQAGERHDGEMTLDQARKILADEWLSVVEKAKKGEFDD